MTVCSINNSEFDVISVDSELNTISVDSINAFSNILECKINSKDIILEKVGDIDGRPLVILELNINGNDYVTEAIITDDKDSYIKINENNLHGVIKPALSKEVLKEEKEEETISEERLEEISRLNAGNNISAVLAESLTNYNTKKLNEELKNYENIYNNKVREFEDKKKELLNLVEKQFTSNVNILKEDVDKKVDLFFKKTDLNNKTSIAIETDRLKDTINEKYKDFIEELNQKKDLISEDTNERVNKLINLVEKKEKELKDSVKVFVEKIYTKHQQQLNPQIENILNDNKQLNEKLEKLEALKNEIVDSKVYSEDLSKSESNLKNLLRDTNKKFNKINEKFKVLSEKDNKRYNSLLAAINNTDTKEYETVLNNKIEEAELGQIKEELEQKITNNMQNEMTSLKRYVEMSSGGGNVAVQYANGGTMNGDLTLTGGLTADNTIQITNPIAVGEGLRFTHELSGPGNNEFNMYFEGPQAGAAFILNKKGSGGPEVIFFHEGHLNLNGGFSSLQGGASGNRTDNVGIGVNSTGHLNGVAEDNVLARPTNKLHIFESNGRSMGTFPTNPNLDGALVRIEQQQNKNMYFDGGQIYTTGNDLRLVSKEAGPGFVTLYPGRTKVLTVGKLTAINESGIKIELDQLPIFADNAAATVGNLDDGHVYRTATGQLMIKYS